jgi:hypothetical protein
MDSLLKSAMSQGGRTTRYANNVVVYLQGMAFVTTASEYQAAQMWARAKVACGVAQRDRMRFSERFGTTVGRNGGGVATKGAKSALQAIVTCMMQSGMQLEEWMIPRDLFESIEIKRKAKPVEPVPEAADEIAGEAPAGTDEVDQPASVSWPEQALPGRQLQ